MTVALAVVLACSSEEIITPDISAKKGGTFTVSAKVAQQLYSRADGDEENGESDIDDGIVKDGVYYLSYPLPTENNEYTLANVYFNNAGFDPQIGVVIDSQDKALTWVNIGGGATPNFYLDNVGKTGKETESSSETEIKFTEEYNPFKADLFDEKTNDLLWGEQSTTRYVNSVNFNLHHNMARIRVQVTVDRTNDVYEKLDLDKATVEISSINQNPLSYNRLTGLLQLKELNEDGDEDGNGDGNGNGNNYSDIYKTLTLVDPKKDAKKEWAKNWTDEENEQKVTYLTKDFVLPPQGLLTNENRPQLIIKFGDDGPEYTGILPHAMEIYDGTNYDENNKEIPYPAALYFLKEHILTIRTEITEDPPELAFMPVWVVKWVYKGEFDLEAHQAGIYTAQEFYKLIDYYNGTGLDGKSNEYQLVRYGHLVESTETPGEHWEFDFFSSVAIDYSEIHGKMVPGGEKKEFSFNTNNWTISVRNNGEEKAVTGQKLYEIVTCKSPSPSCSH